MRRAICPLRADGGTLNGVSRRSAQIDASQREFKPTRIFSTLRSCCGAKALGPAKSFAERVRSLGGRPGTRRGTTKSTTFRVGACLGDVDPLGSGEEHTAPAGTSTTDQRGLEKVRYLARSPQRCEEMSAAVAAAIGPGRTGTSVAFEPVSKLEKLRRRLVPHRSDRARASPAELLFSPAVDDKAPRGECVACSGGSHPVNLIKAQY